MKIQLVKLVIYNFKGIKDFEVAFALPATSIFGENAAGKTTIADAFYWLLWGKNSVGKEDFNIKTLDSENKTDPKAEVEIRGHFLVDGNEVVFKKVLREKWVKKQGTTTSELQGNEVTYYWNDAPVRMKDYQVKVDEIINESKFKLITNPFYFNSLKWEERRAIITELAGEITSDEVLDKMATFHSKDEVANITGIINLLHKQKKSLEEFKKQLAMEKGKIKKDMEGIGPRISEVKRGRPESIDFAKLDKDIEAKQAEIKVIEDALSDAVKALTEKHRAINEKQNQLQGLRSTLRTIEFEAQSAVNEEKNSRVLEINRIKSQITSLQQEVINNNNSRERIETKRKGLESQRQELRDKWNTINAGELKFNPDEFICPTCKREFEAAEVDDQKAHMLDNFNQDKQKKLDNIQSQGKGLATEIEALDKQIAEFTAVDNTALIDQLQEQVQQLEATHNELNKNSSNELEKNLKSKPAYFTTQKSIEALEAEIQAATSAPAEDNSELKASKAILQSELDLLKSQLGIKAQIEKANNRVTELEEEESTLAQKFADLEASEFAILNFEKAKMDSVEERINGKFTLVTFKLFNRQYNGGENACCITLINGVPFADANNAAKINAGIDIINALSNHYDAYAPIFIDNRESVNQLIPTESQIINLIVSPDKKLRVA